MKAFLHIISILLFVSCNSGAKVETIQFPLEKSKIVDLKLIDSLGNVTITLPTRYDTTFSWKDQSDCGKPCDEIKYRWQPKTLRITKESGWIWLGEPKDSVERFTIAHSGYFPFHDNNDSSFIFQFHERQKRRISQHSDTYKIKSATVEKIGDRYFSVIASDLYDTIKAQYSKKLLAATTIKSNIVYVYFELLTKQKDAVSDNFIENSKYYLSTIRLSNGK